MMSSPSSKNTSEMPINNQSKTYATTADFVYSLETTQDLRDYAKIHKLKQSRNGVCNKWVRRQIIAKHLMGRELTHNEEYDLLWRE